MPVNKSKINPSADGQKSKAQVKTKKLIAKTKNVFEKPHLSSRPKPSSAGRSGGISRGFARNDTLKTDSRKKSDLALDFFDTKGKVVDAVGLPKEIFGAKINNSLMAQAVRVYLANQRMGTSSTKTRGEVRGSTRKIWRQKGTGRARHGSRKAPIFVGGGIVFGPKPRDFSLKLSKKMKRLALFSSLSSKQKRGEIKGITGFEKLPPKTRVMAAALKSLEIIDKYKKIALVLPSTKKDFQNLYRASRNIEDLTVFNASLLNAYAVLNSDLMLLTKDSLRVMEDTFLKRGKNEE